MIITDNVKLTEESFTYTKFESEIIKALSILTVGLPFLNFLYSVWKKHSDTYIIVSSLALLLFGFCLKIYLSRKWELQKYEKAKKPIFIIQENEKDSQVSMMVKHIESQLELSNNQLFINGEIFVKPLFFQDPTYDFCETEEKYKERVIDTITDSLRTWAEKISKKDRLWVEEFLLNQNQSTPSVSWFEKINFWAKKQLN